MVGGGETAFDQACSLTENGAKVIIAVRGEQDRVFDELRREAKTLRIQIRYGTEVVKIVENKNKIEITLKKNDRYLTKYFNYCLAAIGGRRKYAPNIARSTCPAEPGGFIWSAIWPAQNTGRRSSPSATASKKP